MTIDKPNLAEFKHKGMEILNLTEIANKTAHQLEMLNPGFLFENSYDYDQKDEPILVAFYVVHRYYVGDEAGWRSSCQHDTPNKGFSVDFNCDHFDTLYSYIDYIDVLE